MSRDEGAGGALGRRDLGLGHFGGNFVPQAGRNIPYRNRGRTKALDDVSNQD
jgi:hypothetical protein